MDNLCHYSLINTNYLGSGYLRKSLYLKENSKILSLHENVDKNGIPCSGIGISVLEDSKIKAVREYEFLIFPVYLPKTEWLALNTYTFLGTYKVSNSYYDFFVK